MTKCQKLYFIFFVQNLERRKNETVNALAIMKVALGNCAVVASRAECKLKWALLASWYPHFIYKIIGEKDFPAIFCVLLKHTTRTKLSLEFLPSAPFGYRYKAVNSSYKKETWGQILCWHNSMEVLDLAFPLKKWFWKIQWKNKRKMEIAVHAHLFS